MRERLERKGPRGPSPLGGDPVPHRIPPRGPSHYAPMQGTMTTHQVGRIPRASLPPRHSVDRGQARKAGALLARKPDCCCLLADLLTQGGGPPHGEVLRPGRDCFGGWSGGGGRMSARMKPCGAGPLVSLDPGAKKRQNDEPGTTRCVAQFLGVLCLVSKKFPRPLDSPRSGCALRPSAPLPGCPSFFA